MKKSPTTSPQQTNDLQLVQYNLESINSKGKVVLEHFVISFLLQGHKLVTFADTSAMIDNSKALVIAHGNCLVAENGYGSHDFKSLLLFFSRQRLNDLIAEKGLTQKIAMHAAPLPPYFIIEQDEFIKIFISSMLLHFTSFNTNLSQKLLEVKFEEVMIYLIDKYGDAFINFLLCSPEEARHVSFKTTIESNKYSSLGIDELAFLCNMSVSTFKRRFAEEFNDTPGNWLKAQKLEKARALLQSGGAKPSEVVNISGYKNLSHFSNAYKARFGKSPKHTLQD